jgi:hypothetical protein
MLMRGRGIHVTYVIFDLLSLDGKDLTRAPYSERRAQLEALDLNGVCWQTPQTFESSGWSVETTKRAEASHTRHPAGGSVSLVRVSPHITTGHTRPMKRLNKQTLRGLLQMYEAAIQELEALRDPGVTGLLRRMEQHRAEVIAALAAQDAA